MTVSRKKKRSSPTARTAFSIREQSARHSLEVRGSGGQVRYRCARSPLWSASYGAGGSSGGLRKSGAQLPEGRSTNKGGRR